MSKVTAIDFSTISLRDALDLATLVEQEAKERYEEFAHQMELHHTEEAARFFRKMIHVEAHHEDELAKRRKALFGDEPMHVRREQLWDVEAPEYGHVRALMSHRRALEAALRAEQKAYAFFDEALKVVSDPGVRELFEHLRAEEEEHERYVRVEMDRLPPDPPIDESAFEDEPVMQ